MKLFAQVGLLVGGRLPDPAVLSKLDAANLHSETELEGFVDQLRKVSGTSARSAYGTRGTDVASGKRYFEVTNLAGGTGVRVGLSDATRNNAIGVGDSSASAGITGSVFSAPGAVASICYDTALTKYWTAGSDGVFSGDPAAGTGGATYSGPPLYPMVSVTNVGDWIEINFGQYPFRRTPPTGFSAVG